MTIHCGLDVSDFPYDHQTCVITATSWSFTAKHLMCLPDPNSSLDVFQPHPGEWSQGERVGAQYFTYGNDKISTDITIPNTALVTSVLYFLATLRFAEWDLVIFNISSKTNTYEMMYGDPVSYIEVLVTFGLDRKPIYYVLTLVAPSFAITTLCLLGLWKVVKNFQIFKIQDYSLHLSQTTHGRRKSVLEWLDCWRFLWFYSWFLSRCQNQRRFRDSVKFFSIFFWIFQISGTFIIVEMFVIFLCTVIQVGIMFLHGQAVFKRHVPQWLAVVTFLSRVNKWKKVRFW